MHASSQPFACGRRLMTSRRTKRQIHAEPWIHSRPVLRPQAVRHNPGRDGGANAWRKPLQIVGVLAVVNRLAFAALACRQEIAGAAACLGPGSHLSAPRPAR
jgi:hypothetical protein